MNNTVTEETNTDLIKMVNDVLIKLGHQRPTDWMCHLHPDGLNTTDNKLLRFLINRAFRIILGSVSDENTMDARYCLVDTGEIKDWIRLFETGVAPTIVRLSLPPAIN